MDTNLSRDIQCYSDKSGRELLEFLARALDELKEFDAILIENSRANAAMAKDYMSLVDKCRTMEEEIKMLKTALNKSVHDNQIKTSDIFGRSTEKLSEIIDTPAPKEIVDEDTVEESGANIIPTVEETGTNIIPIDKAPLESKNNEVTRKRRKKSLGKRKKDLANIPSVNVYQLDVNELDRQYGENNWRITYWHSHRSVECIPTTVYEKILYVPVISVGLEHMLCSIPQEIVLIKNSIASASLAALILYHKFFLALPIYRQEIYFKNLGLILSRQTMNNWANRLSMEVFSLLYDRMTELLMQVEYHQCDETYIQVNKDGREAGSKSFMWVHISSELVNEHPIIIYSFELTRGTDHLRKFYEDFKGYITCDAYISYHVLGKENLDVIIICGCMMHLRRRFVKSLSLIDTKGLDYNTIEALPETKVLKLIGKIYDEDEPLKALSAEKRKEMRDQKVRPLINELYEYIDNFDITDHLVSDRLKDAFQYARNQKDYMTKFLENGNIPIDNGATERTIRSLAIGRNNWIACDSITGAETTAIMYSIVETAKANKVNVYLYLRYLLEQIPIYLDGKSLDFLDNMLPWSEEYLSYEKTQKMSIPNLVLKENEYYTRPKTPRKKESGDPPKLILVQDSATA